MKFNLGIDIGSTTAKVVLTCDGNVIYEKYQRHFSQVREKLIDLIEEIKQKLSDKSMSVAISGSAGLGLAEAVSIPFVQEVFATGEVVKKLEPDTGCVIELGGEDAKIIFFGNGIDERMNGSCAGGTGAFIDQMASLLNVSTDELDVLSLNYTRIYPIASRCGVFAKTDIQPLLNQGARKEDIAASIYQAVVNQAIAGLAQGKKITGKTLFLGGPLYYCKGLRERFKETLHLSDDEAIFPEYGRFAVAYGAALYADKENNEYTCDNLLYKLQNVKNKLNNSRLEPLFANEDEYDEFCTRHARATVRYADIEKYSGKCYLGIDCGSTTTKLVLLTESNEIIYSYYSSNRGNPVEVVREQLCKIYEAMGDRIHICGSGVTGYGEELIRNAFSIDYGIVETIAHYTAAKFFNPNVNFILDIGGQDIKCFRIKNGSIDSIMLNEACSSGCGSFLETFAKAMGYTIEDFARKGLFSKAPVNLGSRCTVFMNSSVKQSQKDGATVEDISAGLSVSVVKNALHKVIRIGSADELGENVIVQGGTFYNDAVLRAFEKEIGRDVVRPSIAGLMGAYGAALFSKRSEVSSVISYDYLRKFEHSSSSTVCNGCTNHCHLTVNKFCEGRKYISGNRCEKGIGKENSNSDFPNLYEFKREYLKRFKNTEGTQGTINLPLSLGMFELLPLWYGIFKELGFGVHVSKMSTRRTYEKGQFTIPSDTACYPAKIMHGHIEELLECDEINPTVFYPCLSYNSKDKTADNNYNCPIVAYYSELLNGNVDELRNARFLYPYLNINNKSRLAQGLYDCLHVYYPMITLRQIRRAVKYGFGCQNEYISAVAREGQRALEFAQENNKRVMILAGRPYHIDSEICHNIDKLAVSLGFVVVSEDSVYMLSRPQKVKVLNQWTYHARLYRAAGYATEHKNAELVQLVSFGCGVDAITTDEVRRILESKGKYYTQLKIDEITNLGAVKIRLRSLLSALEENERNCEEDVGNEK